MMTEPAKAILQQPGWFLLLVITKKDSGTPGKGQSCREISPRSSRKQSWSLPGRTEMPLGPPRSREPSGSRISATGKLPPPDPFPGPKRRWWKFLLREKLSELRLLGSESKRERRTLPAAGAGRRSVLAKQKLELVGPHGNVARTTSLPRTQRFSDFRHGETPASPPPFPFPPPPPPKNEARELPLFF